MPTISVVMAVYNGMPYVTEAVESILHQSFEDFEFIIVNDASTDDTLAALRRYTDARLRIVDLPDNVGQTAALNLGLEAATGEFIARQDADDRSLPARFAQQLAFFAAHPDHLMVGTTADMIDETGKIVGFGERPYTDAEVRQAFAEQQNYFYHGSVMFRREVLQTVGMYRDGFRSAQDFDYWLRIAEKGKVGNLRPPVLYQYRLHPQQQTFTAYHRMKAENNLILKLADHRAQQGDDSERYATETRQLADFFATFQPTPRQKRRALSEMWRGKGVFHMQAGRRLPMMYCMLRALLVDPTNPDFWQRVRHYLPGGNNHA